MHEEQTMEGDGGGGALYIQMCSYVHDLPKPIQTVMCSLARSNKLIGDNVTVQLQHLHGKTSIK